MIFAFYIMDQVLLSSFISVEELINPIEIGRIGNTIEVLLCMYRRQSASDQGHWAQRFK